MGIYSVRGLAATTAVSADVAVAQLWNNSSTEYIKVLECGSTVAGTTHARCYFSRSTARGTAGSTITPDADNAWDSNKAPSSGALMDLSSFSAQPTLATPPLHGFHVGASGVGGSGGAGFIYAFPDGIVIPPSDGFVIVNGDAVGWGQSECFFVWEELDG